MKTETTAKAFLESGIKEKDIKYIEENFNILESELNKVILIGKNYIKGVKV